MFRLSVWCIDEGVKTIGLFIFLLFRWWSLFSWPPPSFRNQMFIHDVLDRFPVLPLVRSNGTIKKNIAHPEPFQWTILIHKPSSTLGGIGYLATERCSLAISANSLSERNVCNFLSHMRMAEERIKPIRMAEWKNKEWRYTYEYSITLLTQWY